MAHGEEELKTIMKSTKTVVRTRVHRIPAPKADWEQWISMPSAPAASRANGPEPAATADDGALQEAIATLAYSYWESRGYQGGSAEDDWLRAEAEVRHQMSGSARG